MITLAPLVADTTSASATRLMDECVQTGISSLIGQSEGVVFFEIYFTPAYVWQFN